MAVSLRLTSRLGLSPLARVTLPTLGSSESGATSDAVLVAAALSSDRDAMEELVRRHYDAAFAVALSITRETADAEDICHDAFVRAVVQLDSCRDPTRFRAWLCAIVRNHAHNTVSRGAAAKTTIGVESAGAALESKDDAARRAELSDLRRHLLHALDTLSPAQREVVLLHDLAEWDHAEIAASLGTSAGMCRQHLFRARRALRELLRKTLSKEHLKEYFDDR